MVGVVGVEAVIDLSIDWLTEDGFEVAWNIESLLKITRANL